MGAAAFCRSVVDGPSRASSLFLFGQHGLFEAVVGDGEDPLACMAASYLIHLLDTVQEAASPVNMFRKGVLVLWMGKFHPHLQA